MWVPLPTTMAKYFHHSPMMLPKDTMEAPVNSRLHQLQPRQAKDQIHGQGDHPKVPTLYNPWGKSHTDFTGYPKAGPLLPICQAYIKPGTRVQVQISEFSNSLAQETVSGTTVKQCHSGTLCPSNSNGQFEQLGTTQPSCYPTSW